MRSLAELLAAEVSKFLSYQIVTEQQQVLQPPKRSQNKELILALSEKAAKSTL